MKIREHLLIAALTAALGLLVFTGGGRTLARWSHITPASTATPRAGQLSFTQSALTYKLTHVDFTAGATVSTQVAAPVTSDITTTVGATKLMPGDIVTISTDVTITAIGNNLAAELAFGGMTFVSSDAALVTELSRTDNQTLSLAPVASAPALTSLAANKWRVTPANNGFTYRITVTAKIRATTNGSARGVYPTSTPDPNTNWWQNTFQNSSATSSFRIQLNQVAT